MIKQFGPRSVSHFESVPFGQLIHLGFTRQINFQSLLYDTDRIIRYELILRGYHQIKTGTNHELFSISRKKT